MNLLYIFLSALVPMVLGFIWYNPKVFGKAWMAATGMTPEKAKTMNMAVVFGTVFVMSFIFAFFLQSIVIHQFHLFSLFYKMPIDDPSTEAGALWVKLKEMFLNDHLTFKHGAFHGFLGGLFLITPAITVHALFEAKGFKYIAINAGYWIVSMTIMGGILSATATPFN